MRAHGVLGDEEPLRDLVRSQVLVEKKKHFDFTRGEELGDRVGDASETAVLAHTIEKPAGDTSREGRVAANHAAQERRDLLGRFGLEEVAGCSCSDRCEEVLLGVRRSEHNDLGPGCLLTNLW